MISCGLVGLPNIGKSTIFNVLSQTNKAEVANYPFCTIHPNKTIINIPDPKLKILADIANSRKIIPATLELVDIAGLIKNAYKGEGLGNQFLSQISMVDMIIHVVRCFSKNEESLNPIEDIDIIDTELLLFDHQILEKKLQNVSTTKEEKILIKKIINGVEKGLKIKDISLNKTEQELCDSLNIITSKPTLYLCNIDENPQEILINKVQECAQTQNAPHTIFSARIEQELMDLTEEEQQALGIVSHRKELILEIYKLLNIMHFFTVGEKETRGWQIPHNTIAMSAAKVVHSDFQKHFISAERVSYEDFVNFQGYKNAREAGKVFIEGKNYCVQDDDILHFKSYK